MFQNEEKFMKHLQIVRREQIGPLSAASMESGSYQRGYQHIVRQVMHIPTIYMDKIFSLFIVFCGVSI